MLNRLMLAALFAIAPPALATLQISANVNGSVVSCVDNAACDTNLAVGQMTLANFTLNGVDVFGSSQAQQVGATNFLNTSSFQIVNHNTSAATVVVAVGGTNFVGPVASVALTGSGSWQNAAGSTIDLSWFADVLNAQGADTPTDLPGTLLASFSDLAVGLADSFSFSNVIPFADPNFYSMSMGTSGVLAAWNGVQGQETTLVGRNQAMVTLQAVPEPITLALVGVGLVGLGFARRQSK
jgi:hypothetical protein